jgi:hypothetical protein
VGPINEPSWVALGLTVTLLGLAASFVLARRRGAAAGLRLAGWSLLPLAAALTGLLRVIGVVVDAVVVWAGRLVFSPVVWAGVVLAGVAVLMILAAGVLRARQGPGKPAAPVRGKDTSKGGAKDPARDPASNAAGDEDMDDIEAILRRHGIS